MSADATIYADISAGLPVVKQVLKAAFAFEEDDFVYPEGEVLLGLKNASCLISFYTFVDRRNTWCQALGIEEKINIDITCRDKLVAAYMDEWAEYCVKIPLCLIDTYGGDLYQVRFDDSPFLLYRQGQLYLLNRSGQWTLDNGKDTPAPELALIERPYEFADIEALYLRPPQ